MHLVQRDLTQYPIEYMKSASLGDLRSLHKGDQLSPFHSCGRNTGDTLLHVSAAQGDSDAVSILLQVSAHAAGMKNVQGLPLEVATKDLTFASIAALAVATPTDQCASLTVNCGHDISTLRFLNSLLNEDQEKALLWAHVHICGDGLAGKSTLLQSMPLGAQRDTFWKQINPFQTGRYRR